MCGLKHNSGIWYFLWCLCSGSCQHPFKACHCLHSGAALHRPKRLLQSNLWTCASLVPEKELPYQSALAVTAQSE